ncbi:MAG: hypothetical protein QOI24_2223 [Acidobacteriota bacterium]|nr:hypothetical protein [Acidobacteriota bacterium]
MAGDERVRHCTLCSLNVYNFAEMTRDDIRALLVRTEGRVCARLYRRADGTLLTSDCPSGFQVLRQRMSRMAATVGAALFSVSAFASDGATCEKPLVHKDGTKVKFTATQVATARRAGLTGVVTAAFGDPKEAPLPGVPVTLRNETTKREVVTETDANGIFTFPSLDDGLYRMEVKLSGLTPAVVEHMQLKQNQIMRVEVSMQVQALMGEVIAVSTSTGMPDGPATTFSQELINKLPI